MPESWIPTATHELLQLRGTHSGWAYRSGASPSAEPTALASFALLASSASSSMAEAASSTRAAGDWLAALQNTDGSVGVAAATPAPGWATPYALLLWQALSGYEQPRSRAAKWLLQHGGKPLPRESDPEHIVGHDTSLIGWPWVADTHSWLEPTAMAILALRKDGVAANPRVREGVRLIIDRAIVSGGWNYGNKAAFGHPLRPQPAPTGLALLALAGEAERPPVVDPAIRYLQSILPETRAAASLGWGLLGLRAWGALPAHASEWLAEAAHTLSNRPDAAPRLATLLLAAGDRALELLVGNGPGGRGG
jgi:hypothetical protein